jgi:hypothetical protein
MPVLTAKFNVVLSAGLIFDRQDKEDVVFRQAVDGFDCELHFERDSSFFRSGKDAAFSARRIETSASRHEDEAAPAVCC